MSEYHISRIFYNDRREMKKLDALLEKEGIERDDNLDYTIGLYDDDYNLAATGSCFANTLRCMAVDSGHQGEGLLNQVVSHLIQYEFEQGTVNLFLYTKYDKALFFRDLGFYEVARADGRVVFMENRKNGFASYLDNLYQETQEQVQQSDAQPEAGLPVGAVVMNAGAYGGEMKQVVVSVRGLDKEGEILTLDNDTMEFGYRSSAIRNRPIIVLEVTLQLAAGEAEAIGMRMEELAAQRRSKQTLEYPSAGSTFKRSEGYFAGKLIMDAGLRGYRIGGAQVSEKHCGFVVNRGGATAADIREVIEEVQERVRDRFHVTLEPEIVFLGDF